MGKYGNIWENMGTYGNIWENMGIYGKIWEYMAKYGNIWEHAYGNHIGRSSLKQKYLQIMICAFFFFIFFGGIGDIFEQAQLHSGFHFVPVDLF